MTAKRFLIASLFLFLALLASYALVVDRLVIVSREVPYSYRQFLLESASDTKGKVVVESGSNSVHSIDPFLLANYFEAPVLTTAGNAGYPLRLRILNLQHHLHPGDVLLLPLEWNQYQSEERYAQNFLQALADKDSRLSFFYTDLPLPEKLRFIFRHYPPREAWRGLRHNRQSQQRRAQDLDRLTDFERKVLAFDNTSFGNSMRNRRGDREDTLASKLGCNQYLFASQLRNGFDLSDEFLANLALLSSLADGGVRVYFTWPAVVDGAKSNCYRGQRLRELLPAYAAQIENTLSDRGFQMLGDYEDSRFSDACFLDTYYHLRRDCAGKRTSTLIGALTQSRVKPVGGDRGQEYLAMQVKESIERLRFMLTP